MGRCSIYTPQSRDVHNLSTKTMFVRNAVLLMMRHMTHCTCFYSLCMWSWTVIGWNTFRPHPRIMSNTLTKTAESKIQMKIIMVMSTLWI